MNRLIISKHQHSLGEGVIWDHRLGLLLFVDILSKSSEFFRSVVSDHEPEVT